MCMPGCRVSDSRRDHFAAVEASHCRRLSTDCRLREHYSHWHWDPCRLQRVSRLRLSAGHWRTLWIQMWCCEVLRLTMGHTMHISLRSGNHKSVLWVPYYSRIWWREIFRLWRSSTWSLNCSHFVNNTEQNKISELPHSYAQCSYVKIWIIFHCRYLNSLLRILQCNQL